MWRSVSSTSLPCRGQCTLIMGPSSTWSDEVTSGSTAHVRKNPAKLSPMAVVQRARRPAREKRSDEGHLVAAVVGSRAAPFELATAHEVFGLDRSEYADPWYRFRVVAVFESTIPVTDGDWTVSTPYTLADLADVDTVIVPVWPERSRPAPPDLLDALRAVHERGGRVVSVCSGAFLLAQTGLLDGRRATTHWMYTSEFTGLYPAVDVDRDVLFVDAGDGIYTSAGTAAGIDLCLHIVRLDHGADVANKVARRMVVPPQRDGGQAQFVDAPMPELFDDDPIARTLDWAMVHL